MYSCEFIYGDFIGWTSWLKDSCVAWSWFNVTGHWKRPELCSRSQVVLLFSSRTPAENGQLGARERRKACFAARSALAM
jgi:hypothetical protein